MSRNLLPLLFTLMLSAMVLAILCSKDVAACTAGHQSEAKWNMASAISVAGAQHDNPPRDQSKPGAAKSASGETDKKLLGTDLPVLPAGWGKFSNYGFSVCYSNDFVVQSQDISKLDHFTPMPVASIFFMNPANAGRDLAGIEPPDLEVRVYQAAAVDSLKSWLVLVGFVDSGTVVQAYRNAGAIGLKVSQSTMIFPGSHIYFLHRDRVYQLTAFSREGEAMIDTFTLLP